MEKVKLTQDQADAIEVVINRYGEDKFIYDYSKMLHEISPAQYTGSLDPINDLALHQVAKALYIGYEVEPEFKVSERLEEIKELYGKEMYSKGKSYLTMMDILWLIEQAERAEELEMKYENTGAIFSRQNMRDRIQVLEQENKRYREALESIANIDGHFMDKPFNLVKALSLIDGKARKALEELE